jgi:anti-sigma factor RsiW
MSHESAVLRLPEYLEGRLDPAAAADVAAHLGSCDECRQLSRTYRIVTAPVRHAPADPAHSASADLVACALGEPAPPAEGRADVRRHLGECPACSDLVRAIEEAEAELGPRSSSRASLAAAFPRSRPYLAAAAAAVLLLGYPAYLGIFRLPGVEDRLAAAAREGAGARAEAEGLRQELDQARDRIEQSASWSGPVALPFLSGSVRGGDEPEARVALAPGQPFVLLAVEPQLPPDAAGGERFLFEVRKADGIAVWSREMTASEIREVSSGSGALVLALPAGDLPPAHYALRLGRPAGPTALTARFEVVRAD